MAFVPGFDHDVFISYAHGDDRAWISAFHGRLKPDLNRLLPGADVWIDSDDLRKSRDFNHEIPANLASSAVLVSLVSPTYIQRPYCVQKECRRFIELATARKETRFRSSAFSTELFGFRCPIFQMPDSAYSHDLIPGATDILFGDDVSPFPVASNLFENSFRTLLRGLTDLLRRMRNHSTPVVVYPHSATSEINAAHEALTRELHAQSYRVLPEDELKPVRHVGGSDLAVLLLGPNYDDTARLLVDEIKNLNKPFVIWPSPSVEQHGDLTQRGFLKELSELDYQRKTLLSPLISPEKLKQDVFAILNPQAKIPANAAGKPRIYLIYDSAQKSESANAGQIVLNYQDEFHFEPSDNPRQHTGYLTQSDGVLLVWGEAAEDWCATEFEQIVRLSNQPKSRGLCLFDPKQSKLAYADQIRSQYSAIHVAEQFGAFEKRRLEPFFAPIRRGGGNSRTQAAPA
jgi:hypothetical protein